MPLLTATDLELLFEELPRHIYQCPGQLTFYDRLTYYWAGKQFYTGAGVIVDAGALVGGTALLLSYGLANNPNITQRENRIISYDLFEDAPGGFMANAIAKFVDLPAAPLVDGKLDFEPVFRHTTAQYAHVIQTRRGDISRVGYDGAEPIEIMSVDVGKTPALMRSVALDFFPHLIPGKSIVLNQDYVFPFQPWVAMAMEMLSDFFVLEFEPPTECTTVHRLTRAITRADVEARLSEDFYKVENLNSLARAAARSVSPEVKLTMRAAQIHAYWQLGLKKTAQHVAGQMLTEHSLLAADVDQSAKLTRLFDQIGVLHQLKR